MHLLVRFVCALVVIASPASADTFAARRIYDLPGLDNVAEVAPGLYRGSAPTREGLKTLKEMGVRTVINLRHYHRSSEERECLERGFRYIGLALESSDAPSDSNIRQFLRAATDTSLHPIYFHCWRGKDRTGVMCAMYRMAVENRSLSSALEEMDGFGFYRGWFDLRAAVKAFDSRRTQFRVR